MQDESRLFALKKAYWETEVPPEMEEKMNQAIESAKKSKANRPMRIFRTVGTTAAAFVAAVAVLANASAVTARAMETIPVIGDLAGLLTFRTFEETKNGVEAHFDIPQIEGLDSAAQQNLNAAVNGYAAELIAQYEEEAKLAGEALKEDPDYLKENQTARTSMESTFEVLTDNERIFSIGMETTSVSAGSNVTKKHFTVDKQSGAVLSLDRLFKEGSDYASVLKKEVLRQMGEQMQADSEKVYFPEEFEGIKADQDFYINREGALVLSFDKYDVAPGYMGAVEFVIPAEAIDSIAGSVLRPAE